jgi:glycosyltransferase involved in cell wall biosynthesis
MTADRRASVIVNNHNYARWLGEAIDSALAQTHGNVEVVVVDDGSTDDSREVISVYGKRIVPVLQPNQGQAAAINSGFVASRGDPVLFLDADDVLLETAVERAAGALGDPDVAHVHWYQLLIDDESRPLGERYPEAELPHGDLREHAIRLGPDSMVTSATSGNAFRRWFLDQVMPVAPGIRYCAELYPISLARLFGRVGLIDDPQSMYRRHSASGYFTAPFERQLEIGYEVSERLIDSYGRWAPRTGFSADPDGWRRHSWYHRLRAATRQIDGLLPARAPVLLLDSGQSGILALRDRQVIPFPSRDGIWWGEPADDAAAIAELERHRHEGVRHLAILWTADWYFEHYPRFVAHLRERYREAFSDELLTVFELRAQPT